MKTPRAALSLSLVLLLAACQTTSSTSSFSNPFVTQGPLEKSYHLLFSPADHVAELLGQGEVEKASQVWTHQAEFFRSSERGSVRQLTQTLRTALSARLAPRLEHETARVEAVAWPAPRMRWAEIRSVLGDAQALQTELERHKVLDVEGLREERQTRFAAALEAKTAELRAAAPASFRAEDEAFFAEYPVALESRIVLAETRGAWSAALASAPPQAIVAFRDRHEKALDEEGQAALGRAHYRAALATAKGRGLDAIVTALDATRAAKLPLRGVGESGLAVIEIASAKASGTFPIGIAAELPFAVDKLDLDAALDRKADLVLLLDLRSARTERRPAGKEAVKSEYQSSLRHDDNPQFILARADLRQAESEYRDFRRRLRRREDRCGSGVDCVGFFASFSEAALESEVTAARAKLAATPPKVPVPSYSGYSYTKISTEVVRTVSVGYYLIDRTARVLAEGVVDISESKSFTTADGLHDRDRYASSKYWASQGEELSAFEKTPMAVPLPAVLHEVAQGKSEKRPLPTTAEIRKEIVADRAVSSRRK
jgi:hypothetical protein